MPHSPRPPRGPKPTPPATRWGCERCQVTWRDAQGKCWVCGEPGTAAWVVEKDVPWSPAHSVDFRPGKTPITEVWHDDAV